MGAPSDRSFWTSAAFPSPDASIRGAVSGLAQADRKRIANTAEPPRKSRVMFVKAVLLVVLFWKNDDCPTAKDGRTFAIVEMGCAMAFHVDACSVLFKLVLSQVRGGEFIGIT